MHGYQWLSPPVKSILTLFERRNPTVPGSLAGAPPFNAISAACSADALQCWGLGAESMGWERWGSPLPRLALVDPIFLPVRGMVADVSFEGPGAQEPQELHPPPVHKYTNRDSVCS